MSLMAPCIKECGRSVYHWSGICKPCRDAMKMGTKRKR